MKTANLEITKNDFAIICFALNEFIDHSKACQGCSKFELDVLDLMRKIDIQLKPQNDWVEKWNEAGEHAEEKLSGRTH